MTCSFKVRGIHSIIYRDWLHGSKGILLQGCQNSFVVFRLSKVAQTKLSWSNVMASLMVWKRITRWMHAGFWACLTKQLLVHDGFFNKTFWPMTAADIWLIYLSTKCIQYKNTNNICFMCASIFFASSSPFWQRPLLTFYAILRLRLNYW